MKVRYIKDFPDPSVGPNYVFKKGWTAEHDQSTALTRIADGFCEQVDKETRARKLDSAQALELECMPDPQQPKESLPLRTGIK